MCYNFNAQNLNVLFWDSGTAPHLAHNQKKSVQFWFPEQAIEVANNTKQPIWPRPEVASTTIKRD